MRLIFSIFAFLFLTAGCGPDTSYVNLSVDKTSLEFTVEGGVRQLIARIEKYQNSGEINFRVEDKKGAMDAVRDYFMSTEKATAYMDFDGYRVEFPQWWFNIRPSNTEPYLRFLCEATSKELLDEKVSKVREILKEQFGAE